jgi:2,4-diketo-3-deoxy-L-fuconate hydrolase
VLFDKIIIFVKIDLNSILTKFLKKNFNQELNMILKNKISDLFAVLILILLVGFAVSCGSLTWESQFDLSENLTGKELGTVLIAPPEIALTFARSKDSLILVKEYSDDKLYGINLSELKLGNDPITLFQDNGYQFIVLLWQEPVNIIVDVTELQIPINLQSYHIAVGNNFPEHSDEVGVEDGTPFLFPKIVSPTGPISELSNEGALLDYEVEIALVTLEASDARVIPPEYLGLIAVNDFTDRKLLLENVNPYDVESGRGFTTAKSQPGYLPVGNLFVIPKNYRNFSENLELKLYINKELRQKSKFNEAIWDIDSIYDQIRIQSDRTWMHEGREVSLFNNPQEKIIPERTMILSGTPSGVVFNSVTGNQKFRGFFQWLFFGWDKSIPEHSINNYISDAQEAGIYLQENDIVSIHIENLGVSITTIKK